MVYTPCMYVGIYNVFFKYTLLYMCLCIEIVYQNSHCYLCLEILTSVLVLCSRSPQRRCPARHVVGMLPQAWATHSRRPWPGLSSDVSSGEAGPTFQLFCHPSRVTQACGQLSSCRQEMLPPEINLTANDAHIQNVVQQANSASLAESTSAKQRLDRLVLART